MRSSLAYAALGAIILTSAISFVWDAPVAFIEALISEDIVLGAVVFTFAMFAATVIAPVTVLPLVPLVSPVFGPFLTGTLAVLGWELGAIVAFLIARHAGRPILGRFVALGAIDRYESYIPENTHFLLVVMLRMSIPVDVLSYALGLLSTISLLRYSLASLLGIIWFAYAFAYLGEAAFTDNIMLFGIIAVVSLAVFGLSWWYVIQQVRTDPREDQRKN